MIGPGIRLVDGNETCGLVEVYYQEEWRAVCDDYWTDVEAVVACKQLGFMEFGKCTFIIFQSEYKFYNECLTVLILISVGEACELIYLSFQAY